MNKIISHAFCLCTLFVPVVIGAIIEKPLNMATKLGGETFFNCSSDTTGDISWLYATDFDIATGTALTVSNCQIGSNYTSHYRTEKSGFTCNLIVFNTLLSHGGSYACIDGVGAGSTFQAILIIVDPNATITNNSTEAIHGEDVMILNNVSYRGPSIAQQLPSLPPSFYWTQSDTSQNITSYVGSTTNTSASSYIVVTAEPPNVPPYLCNLFFNSPNNVPAACATNAPTYRTSWETPNYNVLFAPANVSIPENFTACPIDEPLKLTCSADGYPLPTYKWSDLTRDVVISESNTVMIQQSGSYECVASNIIRNVTYNESAVANVSDCFTFVPETTPLSTAQCEDTCVVVVGFFVTLFGLNFLFSIGFIGVYGCSKACRNKLNDRFPWLKKMLPCMNDEGCKCSMWICLFVVLAVFTAIVFCPTILIMANCCQKNIKTSQGNMQLNERKGSGGGSRQTNTPGTKPSQNPSRTPASNSPPPTPPPPLNTSVHSHQDPRSIAYPQSNTHRPPATQLWIGDPSHQNPHVPPPQRSPSPELSTNGIVYAELKIDNNPKSRKPVQLMQTEQTNYATIGIA